ncbi:SWIM zinc finger family protein [Endozoicomonas lisbonensis]|uniref:Zn finger protein n=1 Tax=Endozoicomonas lisbonensis TaxID=3120522 RepID=A0ABV2SND4_9GAMM
MNEFPDITDELLIKLAGKKAFALGQVCFEQGAVTALKTRGKKTTATVPPTSTNRGGQVKLHYTQKGIEGSCDCPESDGIDFCEHCVAAALALRARQSKPTLKKSAKPVEVLTRYFERQSKEDLLQTLVQVINGDKSLRQKWLLQADNALGRLDKDALRKRITSAIPFKRSIQRYHRVRKYFADMEKALATLQEPVQLLPAEEQLELVDYALERLDKATDMIDDSGGYRFTAIELLQAIYRSAFAKVSWTEQKKAKHLVQILTSNEYGFYGTVPDDYVESISPECVDLFYAAVRKQWDALPQWQGGDWQEKRQYSALQRVLEQALKHNDDIAGLIELRQKVVETPYDNIKLAKLNLQLQDYAQAQAWLDKIQGTPLANSAGAQKIQQEILMGTGQPGLALEQQWRTFRTHRDLEEYKALKVMAVRSGDQRNWYQKAETFLEQEISALDDGYFERYQKQDLINLLGWIYLEEEDSEKLWNLINQTAIDLNIDPNLLRIVGRRSVHSPQKALSCYRRIVHFHVSSGNNEGYRNAITLLQELHELLPGGEHAHSLKALLQEVRVKYRIKRNFMAWLDEAFPLEPSAV